MSTGARQPHAPLISVVVPTYQRRASVSRLLDAMTRQTLPRATFEIIVSIDGSTDGTGDVIDEFAAALPVRAVLQANRGRAAACNAGVAASRGELIVLLDDDMEPTPRFLAAHLDGHARTSGSPLCLMGAVPIVVTPQTPPAARYVAAKFGRHLDRLAQGGAIGCRSFYSGNASIGRDTLTRVGLFDEEFTVYGNEDVELAIRLLNAGVPIRYSSAAAAYQHYEKDFPALARDHVAKGRTAVLVALKHPEFAAGQPVRPLRKLTRAQRAARWLLLACTGHSEFVPASIVRAVTWLERYEPPGLAGMYRFALDYFYHVGARSAASRPPPVRARAGERIAPDAFSTGTPAGHR